MKTPEQNAEMTESVEVKQKSSSNVLDALTGDISNMQITGCYRKGGKR